MNWQRSIVLRAVSPNTFSEGSPPPFSFRLCLCVLKLNMCVKSCSCIPLLPLTLVKHPGVHTERCILLLGQDGVNQRKDSSLPEGVATIYKLVRSVSVCVCVCVLGGGGEGFNHVLISHSCHLLWSNIQESILSAVSSCLVRME